jgi:uncharacterized protein
VAVEDTDPVNCLDVVLKVAERCNLACPYCYYFFQENELHKGSAAFMSEATAHAVAAFLRRGVQDHRIAHLYIGLHGGEPTLVPKARLDRIVTILRDALADVTTVHFAMQTNGTLLDDEWIELLTKHRVMVGVSLDGPPHIHDASRPDHRGRGSYDAAVRGLRLLQASAAARRSQAGLLCVANPAHSGEEVVRHIVEDLGVRSFNLLLPREGHDSDVWKPQARWIAYFDEIVRYWAQAARAGNPFRIYLVSDLLAGMSSEAAATRLDRRRSNRHSVITISGKGLVGPDDNIMALDKALCRDDLTVHNTTLTELFATPIWRALVDAVDHPPERCARCEWYRTCRSGDLWNRYARATGFANPSVFCETLDFLHTEMAKIVAQRDGGVEQLVEILRTPPRAWARDYLGHAELPGLPPVDRPAKPLHHLPVLK